MTSYRRRISASYESCLSYHAGPFVVAFLAEPNRSVIRIDLLGIRVRPPFEVLAYSALTTQRRLAFVRMDLARKALSGSLALSLRHNLVPSPGLAPGYLDWKSSVSAI